jgi:hypothetical protein
MAASKRFEVLYGRYPISLWAANMSDAVKRVRAFFDLGMPLETEEVAYGTTYTWKQGGLTIKLREAPTHVG